MIINTPNQVSNKGEVTPVVAALKAAMLARGFSMRALSDRLGVPYRSLQNYFSGESRLPADILLRICAEIGVEADYIARGGFEISHRDLCDAVCKVFGDVLPMLQINSGGRLSVRDVPAPGEESLSAAHILTVRLNEAYARYREQSFKKSVMRPETSSEWQEREATQRQRRRSTKVGE